jgi:hypothetical protein
LNSQAKPTTPEPPLACARQNRRPLSRSFGLDTSGSALRLGTS